MTASHGVPSTAAHLVVSGIGVVTPRGDRPQDAAGTAARAAARTAAGSPAGSPDAAPDRAGTDGWFDHRTRLGPRGYKYLPAASQYFLAAAKTALADSGHEEGRWAAELRGAAVGTNSSAAALHEAMDRTVLDEGAAALSPVTAPYFSINLFGSRLATEHGLKAFNLTVTSPRVAGLESLETGARAVAAGRASWLLAGATEEALAPAHPGHELSERGAVALVLEPLEAVRARGGREYGHCRVRSLFLSPRTAASPGGADRARELIGSALAAWEADGAGAGPAPAAAPRVIAVLDGSPVGRAVATALGSGAERVPAGAGALEPLVQAAGALAELSSPVLVVTAAAEGNLALALLTPSAGPAAAAGA
ncbi:beta-ketoacyl synthase N-terminal-like domain-containing protein [Streptomyces sp. NBC_01408]|uniref:beta-ketoacyl synthase N-terminal-like domain-containing protein n=1 Tax=Streptomyces sp. NBC_01408 TaxID=2903855 RepID=UPI002259A7B1|nr:beta-ketoacyl synthase N-terminal-like domain-containing protein [Streptomyces sp. NBC_01408]MCX4693186.1 3-oxoacyl-ACP synthase [Streptomyces sp. NBC_01408]